MKAFILITSLLPCVITSDIILPVLLRVSNKTSDNVRNSISTLRKVSKNLSIHQSGDESEHVGVLHFQSSSSNSSRQGFSSVSNEEEKTVELSKSSSLMVSVKKMYNSIEFPDLENFRFHVIMEKIVPDLSFIKEVCPEECEGCLETYAEIFCRICCQADMKEPMSIPSFLYDHFDHVVDWLTSSKAFKGLKAIYNNVIGRGMRNANQHVFNPNEIKAFIRNFKWYHSNDPEAPIPDDFEADLNLPCKAEEEEEESEVSSGEGEEARESSQGETEDSDQDSHLSFRCPVDLNPTLFASHEVCGYYQLGESRIGSARIVGGDKVGNVSMFPWQMSLSSAFYGFYYQHRCGAALINDRWALTAAHCTQHVDDASNTGLYLIGGFLDINDHDTAQIRSVDKIINHENFIPKLYENDISLLRTDKPFTYTPSLIPICLPDLDMADAPGYEKVNVGINATLTGWGRQWHTGPLAEQLEMVTLPLIDNKECMARYNASGSRQFIPAQTFLCAGHKEGGKDACSGDSGGPLIIPRKEDGRSMLWGIVSWGIGCGGAGRPGVYTRVSQFTNWIDEKVKNNSFWLKHNN